MKRLALSALLFVLFFASLSAGRVVAEKQGGTETYEKLPFLPLSQWKDTLLRPIPPTINFCNLTVAFEEKGDSLTLTFGGTTQTFKPSPEPAFFSFSKDGRQYVMGVFHTPEGWKYYNAMLAKMKDGKRAVYGFDLNCDGIYFVPGIDGLIYPGSHCVVPCPEWSIWMGDSLAKIYPAQGGGYEMKLEKMKFPKPEIKALALINDFRVKAGLHPYLLDPELSKACRLHAAYIAANGADQIDTPYQERPGAKGYTQEGARIAPSSLYYYFGDIPTAVHVMLGHIFYRTYFVKANINRMGIGFADPISVYNATKSSDKVYDYRYPILIPGPEQTIPYQSYYKSAATVNPDPRPGAAGCGFPVTLTWDWGEKPELVEAKFYFVTRKKEIPEQISASGPNKPATAFYTDNRNIIAVIPLNPLKPKSRYHVVIKYKVDGREAVADWYFNTGKKED